MRENYLQADVRDKIITVWKRHIPEKGHVPLLYADEASAAKTAEASISYIWE